MKNVYFAGSIRGDQSLTEIYPVIMHHLQAAGYHVLSEHLNWGQASIALTDEEIYLRDVSLIDQADLVVAEVSAPSHGVGREICYASEVRKLPVYLLHHTEKRVSAMLLGNHTIGRDCIYGRQTADDIVRIIKNIDLSK